MEHQPLQTLDDSYALERVCAVCGETALAVVHVDDLPDYVNCSSCKSAFILDEATDWAMFGSISADFPETRLIALKRWTTLEAVQAMASSERKPQVEAVSEPTPPFGIARNGAEIAAQASTPPFGLGELDKFVAETPSGDRDPAPAEPLEDAADTAEPEPGHRYIVTLASKTATFPPERCAHCLRRPAPRNLLVSLESLHYEIPLCQTCYGRANVSSDEQKSSKLVAHLSSILIAGLLIVGAIAVGLIEVSDMGAVDLLVIATLGLVGYGLPAILLLSRLSRMPYSDDARFIRSTLRLRETEGLAFGWRNRGYAELFSAANENLLLGELARELEDL